MTTKVCKTCRFYRVLRPSCDWALCKAISEASYDPVPGPKYNPQGCDAWQLNADEDLPGEAKP